MWLVLGLIAGFIASLLVNKRGAGMSMDIVLGIVGARRWRVHRPHGWLQWDNGAQPLQDPYRHSRRGRGARDLSRDDTTDRMNRRGNRIDLLRRVANQLQL